MRLRASERDAVMEALEGEYESPEKAAESIFNLVVGMLAERPAHAVGWRLDEDGPVIAFGPLWDLGAAKRLIAALPGGQAMHKPLRATAGVKEDAGSTCPDCADPWLSHLEGGCVAGFSSKGKTVINRGCGCQTKREGDGK